jgi:hypothetical protein
VTVHRASLLDPSDTAFVRAIPVTTAARALVDTAGRRAFGELARILDDAIVRRILTLSAVDAELDRLPTGPGRRVRALRTLVRERRGTSERGESIPENRLYRWLVRAGLPAPVPQFPVEIDGRRYRIDLAYPHERIAIEYDGWDAHRTRSAFEAGLARDRALVAAGWRPLHFGATSTEPVVVRDVQRELGVTLARAVSPGNTARTDVA